MSEYWHVPDSISVIPCPDCGGVVEFGQLTNWPVELGGDEIGVYLHCQQCEWRSETFHEDEDTDLPAEFFDQEHLLKGWSLNGRYVNGCNGPVRERGFVKYR